MEITFLPLGFPVNSRAVGAAVCISGKSLDQLTEDSARLFAVLLNLGVYGQARSAHALIRGGTFARLLALNLESAWSF